VFTNEHAESSGVDHFILKIISRSPGAFFLSFFRALAPNRDETTAIP